MYTDETTVHWMMPGTLTGVSGDWSTYQEEIINKGDMMDREGYRESLAKQVKDLELDETQKLLQKHGVVDPEGVVTSQGMQLLAQLSLSKNQELVVEKLKKLDEDEE